MNQKRNLPNAFQTFQEIFEIYENLMALSDNFSYLSTLAYVQPFCLSSLSLFSIPNTNLTQIPLKNKIIILMPVTRTTEETSAPGPNSQRDGRQLLWSQA